MKLKKDIEVGDGLPDLCHTSVCTKALGDAGFELVETRDCASDGLLDGGEPWYTPLTPSWHPLKWPRFQSFAARRCDPRLLGTSDSFRSFPDGSSRAPRVELSLRRFNPVMFFLMPKILTFFEMIRIVPAGTSKTQVMLQAGGVGCADGGVTGAFTPMWLMVAKKPLK